MADEKRRFSRIFFNVRAKLTVAGCEYPVDRIANLSVGGCLLEIAEKIPVNSACTFTIFLSGLAEGVVVHGETVRVGSDEISLKFTAIEQENLLHLQNIIRYNAEDPDAIEEEISAHPGLR
ncbi:PilZ domain-containing protein [Desulfopila sp. IMCC35006]|uniref:PilZ domain-containing protein n=1 Tax=Desulfopila sp. IMCC35006 TaxID=2569542 RepID=UPI0010ACEE63|nr:PilZ domain-containing protein [Desulfopila sp. IMCC35006]TKB27074.1 PilZ domain-containing protein [Desulfopila sp. IMCC35006]